MSNWLTDIRRQVRDSGLVYVRETSTGELWRCPQCPPIIGLAATVIPRIAADTGRRRTNIEHAIGRVLRQHTHAKVERQVVPSVSANVHIPIAPPQPTPATTAPPTPIIAQPPTLPPIAHRHRGVSELVARYAVTLTEPIPAALIATRLSVSPHTTKAAVAALTRAGLLTREYGERGIPRYRGAPGVTAEQASEAIKRFTGPKGFATPGTVGDVLIAYVLNLPRDRAITTRQMRDAHPNVRTGNISAIMSRLSKAGILSRVIAKSDGVGAFPTATYHRIRDVDLATAKKMIIDLRSREDRRAEPEPMPTSNAESKPIQAPASVPAHTPSLWSGDEMRRIGRYALTLDKPFTARDLSRRAEAKHRTAASVVLILHRSGLIELSQPENVQKNVERTFVTVPGATPAASDEAIRRALRLSGDARRARRIRKSEAATAPIPTAPRALRKVPAPADEKPASGSDGEITPAMILAWKRKADLYDALMRGIKASERV